MTLEPPTLIARPLLRYHGGKWKLAPWILSHFPKHRVYTESFGGGGSLLLRKQRSELEVYNDTWNEVVNLFQIMRDNLGAHMLYRMLSLTPYAEAELRFAQTECADDSPVERARKLLTRSWYGVSSASANSAVRTGFRGKTVERGTYPCNDYQRWLAHLERFTERLQGVVILNREAIEVLQKYDAPDTLHYVDPPYMLSTRTKNKSYVNEMSDKEHVALAEILHSLTGMVILSGYHSQEYERLYGQKGWLRIDKQTTTNGHSNKIESLYLNPACAARQQQLSLWT